MAPSADRDEDGLDPVEAADVVEPDEDEFDGFTVDDEDDEELTFPEDGAEDEPEANYEDAPDLSSAPASEDPEELTPLLEDDEIAAVVAATDEDVDPDEDDEDALKEGEFICRSCFMAKRDSALADEDAMLCRDCV